MTSVQRALSAAISEPVAKSGQAKVFDELGTTIRIDGPRAQRELGSCCYFGGLASLQTVLLKSAQANARWGPPPARSMSSSEQYRTALGVS